MATAAGRHGVPRGRGRHPCSGHPLSVLITVRLERATRKTSRTSGLPPSQTETDATARRVDAEVRECPDCRARPAAVHRLEDALMLWEAAAAHLRDRPALHAAETGFRVDGRTEWRPVLTDGSRTLKFRHRPRGREAINAIGSIPRHRGVLVHDCRARCFAHDRCWHQLCGAHTLHERRVKHEESVLRFLSDPDVSFTDNAGERRIRMAKVKMRVSGCFRTRHPAAARCRISSGLSSMATRGCNPLVAIQIALAGKAADMIKWHCTESAPGKG